MICQAHALTLSGVFTDTSGPNTHPSHMMSLWELDQTVILIFQCDFESSLQLVGDSHQWYNVHQ